MFGGFVVPDGCGEGEDSLEYAGADAGFGAAAVAFEVELALEGLASSVEATSQRSSLNDGHCWARCVVTCWRSWALWRSRLL